MKITDGPLPVYIRFSRSHYCRPP